MAMNFPNSPTIGDRFPVSPALGQPQYVWNGMLWTTHGVSASSPGKIPIYTDGSNPMTAQLTLVGDPVNPTDAADKHYIDSHAPLAGSVRYDAVQSLSGAQQAQAQSNIGITGTVPPGTVMLFYQTAAPTGWTQVTTQNDKALRVVSASGGVAGGTNPFSTVMAQSVTGNHTLTLSEMAAGIYSTAPNTITTYFGGGSTNYAPYSVNGWNYAPIGAGTGLTYTPPVVNYGASASYVSYGQTVNTIAVASNNTGGGAHNHPITMAIQYCDVILCSKN
jgi:hypothetical protein